jgi:hypothetical protein
MSTPTIDFHELEDAMLLAGDAAAEAWVCRETGKIHIRSDLIDEEAEAVPDDIDEYDKYLPLPDSHDLDLGNVLVFRFVENSMPQEYEQVREIFRKKGAYRRFSNLLDSLGLTDEWHRFRDEQTVAALRAWCEENGFGLQEKR